MGGGNDYVPEQDNCWIESSVYRCLLGRTYTYYKYVVVVGSVWSVLLVLHNYCVIISECQKVNFFVKKCEKNKVAQIGEKIDRKCFLNFFLDL